jgi:nifR3 family TIM-barrel protein
LTLDSNVVLAPMAGVTNLPFRLIAREAGAGLVFTETVSAKGLVVGGKKSWRLVETAPAAEPLAYQLFGNDPQVLAEATRQLVDRGAVLVDLNLGCPVKKFLKHGAGACLLRDPPAIAPILAAMRRAIPAGVLSVKIRLGWDERSITAPQVARIAEAAGVDFVTVHGRTRAQLYRGRASRPRIAEVVHAVAIPVLANGDVETADDVRDMLHATGAAGVMVGRGAMANPWLFRQVADPECAGEPSARDRAALVGRHLELMLRYFDDDISRVHMLKKYLAAYASGMPGAHEFRDAVCRAHQLDTVLSAAHAYFGIAP